MISYLQSGPLQIIGNIRNSNMQSYRAGNLASVLEIDEFLERKWNVFGACPDSDRDAPKKPVVEREEQKEGIKLLTKDDKMLAEYFI
jgi:hypothetical protein